jgi:protein-tyrosine-phosphatase
MSSILFVCTANRFRSPLAAALLRKELAAMGIPGICDVSSAGTWAQAGLPVVPGLLGMARRFNVDLSAHRSRPVTPLLLSNYDLIVAMQAGHREALLAEHPGLADRIYLLSEVVENRMYDIPDPQGSTDDALEIAADLDLLIREGTPSLCALAIGLGRAKRHPGPLTCKNVLSTSTL